MRLFTSIQGKLTLIIGAFLFFMLSIVVTTLLIADKQSIDATVINIAARQQLLSVRIKCDSNALILALESESSNQQQRQVLQEAIDLFDQSLTALKEGGRTQQNNGNWLIIPGSEGDVYEQLQATATLWEPTQIALAVLLDSEVDVVSDEFYDAITYLQTVWQPLYEQAVIASTLLEESVGGKVMFLKLFLLGVLLATFAIGFIGLWLGNQHIITPVRLMVRATETLRQDEFNETQRLPHFQQDELHKIASAINEMRSNLHRMYRDLSTTNATAQRINQALHHTTTSVLIANEEAHIIYCNEAAQALFRQYEATLQRLIPEFNSDELLGFSLATLFNYPANTLLGEGHNIAHFSQLSAEEMYLDVMLNPVLDTDHQHLGWVTELRDRSAEVIAEHALNQVMSTVAAGDYQQRLHLSGQSGFFGKLSEILNTHLDHSQQMLEELNSVFAALVEGRLNRTVDQHYSGDLAALQENVNETVTKLVRTINLLKNSVNTIQAATTSIVEENAHLSQRTEEQASALLAMTANLRQLTQAIEDNAEKTRITKRLATQASDQANQGNRVIHSAVQAMQAVSNSSQQVTEITGLIDEIAFQTNLLALNAAVEAARAGEHGRGFSVVATEVRNLAQRSAAAAKEIKHLIQTSSANVQTGTQNVNQMNGVLQEIVASVKQVTDLMIEIYETGQVQKEEIHALNKIVQQIGLMTQQNAELVEKATISSEALRQQTQVLKAQVDFFSTTD